MAARASSWQRYGPGWPALRRQVFARYGHSCYWCGRFADTVDHLTARVLGGAHSIENLRPACRRCNFGRGAALGNRLRAQTVVTRMVPVAPGPSRDW